MKKIVFALIAPLAVLACGQKDNPSGGGGSDEPASGLAKPTNVVMTEATETTLSFSWDAVPGADSYGYKLTVSGQKTVTGTVTVTSVKLEGLKEATEYSFQVLAMAGDKKSLYSNAVKAKTASSTVDPGDDPGDLPTICVDQPLVFSLNTTPKLGTSGLIQVFDASGKLVDKIDMADRAKMTVLSNGTMVPKEQMNQETVLHTFLDMLHSTRYRPVHYTPIRVSGNNVIIKLHNEALTFGGSYYVTVDESVFGLAVKKGDNAFTVKDKPSGNTLSVDPEGDADFCTLQGALSYATTLGKDTAVTIELENGTYQELLYVRDKNNLTIKGASREGTVIAYPNNESYSTGSGAAIASKPALGAKVGAMGGRGLFLVESCNNLVLEDLTIENTFWADDHKGQAETIYFNADGKRLTIENCSLLSWQDTFLCKGEVWVHNSLIAGHVDYIWGYPKVCLFEDCEIRSRAGGYIVQARVNNATDKGFVFLNCKLTAESGVANGSMYLARSGGDTSKYDNVTFVNCEMSPVIAPAGWHTGKTPTPAEPTAVSGWKEYGTTGVSTSSRNSYGRILTAAEAEPFSSKQAVLGW
jgi:pectin methylesterase-like acyl-CoA thioesterase